MKQIGQQMLNLGRELELPEVYGIARYFIGISHYCRNELSLAEKKLAAGVMAANKVSMFNFAHCAFALALTYQAQGRPAEANNTAEMVVSYALETNNPSVLQIARAFQAELALRQGNIAVKYVGKLLAAFRKERADAIRTASDDQREVALSTSRPLLDDSLTNRELDILALLSQRMSNKEIAEKLFLSPKTVKAHLYNIYQKLYVSTRRQAVEKADTLGII